VAYFTETTLAVRGLWQEPYSVSWPARTQALEQQTDLCYDLHSSEDYSLYFTIDATFLILADIKYLRERLKPFSRFTCQSGSHRNKPILSDTAYKLKDI
jgi:hypothetical protein